MNSCLKTTVARSSDGSFTPLRFHESGPPPSARYAYRVSPPRRAATSWSSEIVLRMSPNRTPSGATPVSRATSVWWPPG